MTDVTDFNSKHPRRNDGSKARAQFAEKEYLAGAPLEVGLTGAAAAAAAGISVGTRVEFRESGDGPVELGFVVLAVDPDEHHPEGGEFTVALDAGGEVLAWWDELTPVPGRDRIETTVAATWVERGVLPTPRHRKPVNVTRTFDMTVGIEVVDPGDAPVGFTINRPEFTTVDGVTSFDLHQQDWVIVDGKVFAPHTEGRSVISPQVNADQAWLDAKADSLKDTGRSSEAAAEKRINDHLDEFKSIGGKLYEQAREPVYQVVSFGFGNGTSLSLADAPDSEDGRPADERYFPADQFDAALEYALAVSEERGDRPEAIEALKATVPIKFTDAYKPGTGWTPAPRIDFTPPYKALHANTFDEELAKFRTQIAAIPGAVQRIPDGFGGTRPVIDYTKLTASQEDHYREYVELEESGRHRR